MECESPTELLPDSHTDHSQRYGFILDRIRSRLDEQQQLQAQIILGWLTFACRYMKVWEVCSAIVFHDKAGALSDESQLHKGILDICKPLIEVRGGDVVALVHASARESVTPAICIPSCF
jgi:hypothetical protein